jgi:hypothetical protein
MDAWLEACRMAGAGEVVLFRILFPSAAELAREEHAESPGLSCSGQVRYLGRGSTRFSAPLPTLCTLSRRAHGPGSPVGDMLSPASGPQAAQAPLTVPAIPRLLSLLPACSLLRRRYVVDIGACANLGDPTGL